MFIKKQKLLEALKAQIVLLIQVYFIQKVLFYKGMLYAEAIIDKSIQYLVSI